jgi:hypothetical protein
MAYIEPRLVKVNSRCEGCGKRKKATLVTVNKNTMLLCSSCIREIRKEK